MFSLLVNVGVYTSHWILNKTYDGAYYMYYGRQQDPIVVKMDQINNRLQKLIANDTSPNHKYYWNIKDKYSDDNWLVIHKTRVLFDTENKSDALKFIADQPQDAPYLLVQVGQEQHMYLI